VGQGAPLVFRFGSETGEMGAKIFRFEAKKVFFLPYFAWKRNRQNMKRNEGKQVKRKQNRAKIKKVREGSTSSRPLPAPYDSQAFTFCNFFKYSVFWAFAIKVAKSANKEWPEIFFKKIQYGYHKISNFMLIPNSFVEMG
jgi:hypothetical protein